MHQCEQSPRVRFRQRMGPHAEEQRLVGLTGAVDADIRGRCRGQEPAEGVECLRPGLLPVGEVAVSWLLGELLANHACSTGTSSA